MDRTQLRRDWRAIVARSKLPEYLQPFANDEAFGFEVPPEVFDKAITHTSRGRSRVSDAAFWGIKCSTPS